MIKSTLSPIPTNEPWPRQYVQKLVETALSANSIRFARALSEAWLDNFPGDLTFHFLLAKSWFALKRLNKATGIIKKVIDTDPEYLAAQRLYQKLLLSLKHPSLPIVNGDVYVLSGKYEGKIKLPKWSETLIYARRAINQENFQLAEKLTHEILGQDPPTPLGAITHIRAMIGSPINLSRPPISSLQKITEFYHKKWPSCLLFDLVLADTLLDTGQEDQAVSMIHHAASRDSSGQVAKRLWGPKHPYLNMWLKNMEARFDIPIPADVSTVLGWNQLPIGSSGSDEPLVQEEENNKLKTPFEFDINLIETKNKHGEKQKESESLKSVKEQLERVAKRIKRPDLIQADGRYPVYVVFTTKQGLISKYGVDTAEMIDKELQQIVSAVRDKENWGAVLVYADDPICMAAFDLKPAKANDPWSLKLLISELDKKLGEKGSMIGSLLIIGGPDVVPYHMLPNPTDDIDAEVPSDNPYATRDENYFIPEWPTGRLPDGFGNDPGLLISVLRKISEYHWNQNHKNTNPFKIWIEQIIAFFKGKHNSKRKPFGFSAEAWLRASVSVYKTIGKPEEIVTSPPNGLSNGFSLSPYHLGYFNLHGLPDAPEWYGQSDPQTNQGEIYYPIAIHPNDLNNGKETGSHQTRVPKIVFTEACFGANIIDKIIDESLALKFIVSGTKVFIGSTAIAYGSIDMNLTSADLLGKTFWRFVKDGYTTGEALYRAKIFYAKEMHERNDYLDGEDQKTLISFIHFGDPLYHSPIFQKSYAKLKDQQADMGILRVKAPIEEINTVCDNCETWNDGDSIPPQVMAHVKAVVEQYLPTMSGAHVTVHQDEISCLNSESVCLNGSTSKKVTLKNHRVVVLNKQIKQAKHLHNRYARLTLDNSDKIVKISVSR